MEEHLVFPQVVVGDGNGIVGHGLGKSQEVTTAISKAIDSAKKNLVKVSVMKGTIPHEQIAKYSGSEVLNPLQVPE